MNHRRFACALLLSSLIPTLSLAAPEEAKQDPAPFRFIGFSKDGNFLAFSYSGSAAESLTYQGKIVFVNVPTNSIAGSSDSELSTSEADEVEKTEHLTPLTAVLRNVEKEAHTVSDKFGIQSGNTGTQVFTHAPIIGPNTRETIAAIKGDSLKVAFPDYELTLNSIAGLPSSCSDGDYKTLGIKVSLKNTKTGTDKILQRDSRVPMARHCPYQYAIKAVHLYQKSIAVFLFALSPGFEGFPNVSYMVVTGTLN